jgi:hypothetical protein
MDRRRYLVVFNYRIEELELAENKMTNKLNYNQNNKLKYRGLRQPQQDYFPS